MIHAKGPEGMRARLGLSDVDTAPLCFQPTCPCPWLAAPGTCASVILGSSADRGWPMMVPTTYLPCA